MPVNTKHFWNFQNSQDGNGPAILRLEGPIAQESWYGDEVTPALFRAELAQHPGDLLVYISSPGGDVVAGSIIYTALRDHPGKVTVRIDGVAASAASVVAMAGDVVQMSPTAYMMIHNASTAVNGNAKDLEAAADELREIDRGIRTAYQIKTGKSDRELARLMDSTYWMSATTAKAEGFCDEVLYTDGADLDSESVQPVDDPGSPTENEPVPVACMYSERNQWRALVTAMANTTPPTDQEAAETDAIRARLRLLSCI